MKWFIRKEGEGLKLINAKNNRPLHGKLNDGSSQSLGQISFAEEYTKKGPTYIKVSIPLN